MVYGKTCSGMFSNGAAWRCQAKSPALACFSCIMLKQKKRTSSGHDWNKKGRPKHSFCRTDFHLLSYPTAPMWQWICQGCGDLTVTERMAPKPKVCRNSNLEYLQLTAKREAISTEKKRARYYKIMARRKGK